LENVKPENLILLSMENVKFRAIKGQCRRIVENYREKRKDDRAFPAFFIQAIASDGSRGEIHLFRKERGQKPYISKRKIFYETIAELAFIIENLGKYWNLRIRNRRSFSKFVLHFE
jgi:hypothetical protein